MSILGERGYGYGVDPHQINLFVRDGIQSVADYNSTLMGVVLVLVLVVVLVVVRFFTMG